MAPGASLVSLQVLDKNGEGSVGHILKALDWVYKYGKSYGVRVVNLSVGAAVTESYYTDPLTLATKTLVDRGITVVAAAGNNGLNKARQPQWGGIASPGQRALGPHGLRFQHPRQAYSVADDTVCPLQLRRAHRDRLFREAGSVRPGRRRGLDHGAWQHAVPGGAHHDGRRGCCPAPCPARFRICRMKA